jgi:hypothetical protein
MKRTLTLLFAVGVVASLFVLGLVTNKQAVMGLVPKVHAQEGCSLATLQGEYLVTGAAVPRLDQRDDPSFPRRIIEVYNFDGAGRGSSFFTLNNGGQVMRGSGTDNLTYTVDSDRCTATLTFANGVQFELFIARDGSQGEGIRVDEDDTGRAVIATRSIKKR